MLLRQLILLLLSMGTIGIATHTFTPATMLTTANTTKPNCPRKCGNLTIPYPFGIGFQCSISYLFSIQCDTSYNPPKAFTMLDFGAGLGPRPDILAITDTLILIRNSQIASRCYNKGGVTSSHVLSYDMPDSPFTFSSALNKLTVIGCDDYALISGYTGKLAGGSRTQYNSVGCLALCSSPNEVIPGSCAGLGCCQTYIPSGLQSFLITLSSLRNHTGLTFQPCGYAFLAGNDSFSFAGAPDFSEEFPITWKMRLQIAIDSAGALAYLHTSSSIPIFHRDIKSSNILLDDKYRAKLSDFGTSRSVAIDQTHVTTRVMGTFGYLDPEYFKSSQYTEKSDVYSFGVVLVELLTGEKAIRNCTNSDEQEDRSLTSWFLSHMETSRLWDIVDSLVLQQGSEEELLNVANLATQCLHSDGKRRPTMKEVVAEMEAVKSLHLSKSTQLNYQHNWAESNQVLTRRPQRINNDDLSSSSTSYFQNRSSDSAELSLLFNPR